MIAVLLNEGYHAEGFGYKKETEEVTHWVTLFEGDKVQMYAYETGDPEFSKVYDTGVVSMFPPLLRAFIQFFNKNHQ